MGIQVLCPGCCGPICSWNSAYEEGLNTVDLTSVENVAQACQLALTARAADGMAFNITNGEPMEFKTLLEHFLAAIGRSPITENCPLELSMAWLGMGIKEPPSSGRTGTYKIYGVYPGIFPNHGYQQARTILGYEPEKTLMESIEEYGKWWKNRDEPVPDRIARSKMYHCGSCTNDLGLPV